MVALSDTKEMIAQKFLRSAARALPIAAMPGSSPNAATVTLPTTAQAVSAVNGAGVNSPTVATNDPRLTPVGSTWNGQYGGYSDAPGFRFRTNSPSFDISRRSGAAHVVLVRNLTSGGYEWIVPPTTNPDSSSSSDAWGGTYPDVDHAYTTYTFPTSAAPVIREIEIRFDKAVSVAGFNIAPGYSLWPVNHELPRMLVVGDSYTDNTGVSSIMNSWANRMGQRLGCDVITQGQGGTGFCANGGNGSGKAVFSDPTRMSYMAQSVVGVMDVAMCMGSINDHNATAAAITPSALTWLQGARAAQPQALLFLTGPQRTPSATPAQALSDANKAAVTQFVASGDSRTFFVDTYALNFMSGSGYSGHPTTPLDWSSINIGTDQLHPTDVGGYTLGDLFASAVLTQCEALAAL